jgi:hypothetical protein
MDEKSFKMILPLMRAKDCSRMGRSPAKIVLKFKRSINQNDHDWEIALHRLLPRVDKGDPKEPKGQFGFINMEIPMSLDA